MKILINATYIFGLFALLSYGISSNLVFLIISVALLVGSYIIKDLYFSKQIEDILCQTDKDLTELDDRIFSIEQSLSSKKTRRK